MTGEVYRDGGAGDTTYTSAIGAILFADKKFRAVKGSTGNSILSSSDAVTCTETSAPGGGTIAVGK
jgi:hypothetical protein